MEAYIPLSSNFRDKAKRVQNLITRIQSIKLFSFLTYIFSFKLSTKISNAFLCLFFKLRKYLTIRLRANSQRGVAEMTFSSQKTRAGRLNVLV